MDKRIVAGISLALFISAVQGFSTSGVPCYLRPPGDKCHYSQKPDSPACTGVKTRTQLENGVRQLNRSMFSLEQQLIRLGVIPPDNACSELPPVLNGGVVYSNLNLAPGTVGKYICNEGYYLQALYGHREFNCNEYGVWNGNVTTTPVTCILMVEKCDPLEEIKNGTVLLLDSDQQNLLPGVMVTYTCDEGYELTGSENRFCLRTGNWSGQDPECIWRTPPEAESQAVDYQGMVAGVSVSSVLLFFAAVATIILVAVIVTMKCGIRRKGNTNITERLLVSYEDPSPTHSKGRIDYSSVSSPTKSKKTSRKDAKLYGKGELEDSTF